MFLTLWHAVFFDPIYNLLIFILNHVPGGQLGIAVVVLTVLIKLILLPLSLRAAKTQHGMRTLEPHLSSLKEKHKGDREKLAKETMEAYKNAGINPFATLLVTLIQIPILFALYFAVSRGGGVAFPNINTALLYSFIPPPQMVNMIFLGVINIAEKSLPLALLAGLAQFYQTKLSLPPLPPKPADAEANQKVSFRDHFARSMQIQMRYVMPLLICFIAYKFSATIALYFLVSGLAGVAQELIVRRHVARLKAAQS